MENIKIETIDDAADVVLIAQNPKSGSVNRGALVHRFADHLKAKGLGVEIIQDIEKLTRQTVAYLESEKLRCVVAAGGDGTVSLLVNRLPAATPLFVFPLGTANLLARHLGISLDIDQATLCITRGKTQTLDIGAANGQLFVVVASCGYDADVVHRLHAGRKGHINYASYLFPVAQSIFGYKFPSMKVLADGKEIDSPKWAFVFNVPKYAIGLRIAPGADPTDGRMDLCSLTGGGFLRGIGYFFAVLFRKHSRLASCQFHQFKTLEISSTTDTEIPIELDGDPAGFTPVKIEVIPDRLKVIIA